MPAHDDIRIGTIVPADRAESYIRQILPYGFESFELAFGHTIASEIDLPRLADQLLEMLSGEPAPPVISALGVYGNPLTNQQTAADWGRLIDAAELFGCNIVAGFAGRLTNRPIPESLPRFQEVFTPLARQAEDRGVKLALENCNMDGDWNYGDWNIAHAPSAWEQMFERIDSPAIGLEWEPCHQMVSLIDPLPQLRRWVHKVHHVHGKDATVLWDVIRTRGIRGGEPYVYHRTPGFGDTNWTDVISILRQAGFQGAIDIEGWHDPVYRNHLEMTGQVHALKYLKQCRGGEYVPNPE